MTAETGVDQRCLAHPRRCPIVQSARVASPAEGENIHTPSLSELSALEDTGPLSAMVITRFSCSQSNAV